MQQDQTSAGPILRLFQARAKPGCAEALAQKLANVSVEVVKDRPGNLGYFFARGVGGDDQVFVFSSFWRDLDSVKQRFGAQWQSSHLPPGYAELIDECSVQHYDVSSGWHVEDMTGHGS